MSSLCKQYVVRFYVAVVLSLGLSETCAAGLTTLYNFGEAIGDARQPRDALAYANDRLVGVTFLGGALNSGAVFSISPSRGDYVVNHSFDDMLAEPNHGTFPLGSLLSSGNKLYGVTDSGGADNSGSVFRSNPDGTQFELVHSFAASSGISVPTSGLISDGQYLFGAARFGAGQSTGSIYRIGLDGMQLTPLHQFVNPSTSGSYPSEVSFFGNSIYGIAEAGGKYAGGTLFKLGKDGTGFSVLHHFSGDATPTVDGKSPTGALTQVGNSLYGVTAEGGASNLGTVFGIDLDGQNFRILHSFTEGDGATPLGGVTLRDGKLFGITSGASDDSGTIFSIRPDGTSYRVNHRFTGSDGAAPGGRLINVNGQLIGTTAAGGTFGEGTVFSYSLQELMGDYDLDGDVDTADFVTWRSTFGSNSSLADGNGNRTVDGADYVLWRKFASIVAKNGDYNKSGVVDGADYVTWRKGLGTTYQQGEYDTWRKSFAKAPEGDLTTKASASVPEPTLLTMLLFAGMIRVRYRTR